MIFATILGLIVIACSILKIWLPWHILIVIGIGAVILETILLYWKQITNIYSPISNPPPITPGSQAPQNSPTLPVTPTPAPATTPTATVASKSTTVTVNRTNWSWVWGIAVIVMLLVLIGYIGPVWRASGPILPQSTGRIADSLVLPPGEGKIDVRFTISSAELGRDYLSMYHDPNQGWQQIRLFINGKQDPSWQWHTLTGKGVGRYGGIKKFLRAGENVLTIEYRLEKQPVTLRDLYLDN